MALTVVTGPPAAGKSTYVQAHAKPGDIVIDYDLIAAALSPGGDTHDHPRRLAKVAYRARSMAIHEALRHVDHIDVWVIHTSPQPDTIATYQAHGAHIITIDPGRDVVMQRIRDQRPASARAVATRWYNTQSNGATQGDPPLVPNSRRW